jgi:hypothetical protein
MGPGSNSADLGGLPSGLINLPLMQDYGIQIDAGSFSERSRIGGRFL